MPPWAWPVPPKTFWEDSFDDCERTDPRGGR
jgi:hypothetical protein